MSNTVYRMNGPSSFPSSVFCGKIGVVDDTWIHHERMFATGTTGPLGQTRRHGFRTQRQLSERRDIF